MKGWEGVPEAASDGGPTAAPRARSSRDHAVSAASRQRARRAIVRLRLTLRRWARRPVLSSWPRNLAVRHVNTVWEGVEGLRPAATLDS